MGTMEVCRRRAPQMTPTERREENCFAGGGGMARKPICPTPPPPPPWAPCREGGLGWRCPTCRARAGGGGGPTPTYVAQNDPHVALIILTTHMWGKFFSLKKISRAKICVPARLVATSVLTQNKGPGTEAHFWNPPPPSFAGRPCHPHPRKAIFGPPNGFGPSNNIPWHDWARFCCAKPCHSKSRLFLVFPSPGRSLTCTSVMTCKEPQMCGTVTASGAQCLQHTSAEWYQGIEVPPRDLGCTPPNQPHQKLLPQEKKVKFIKGAQTRRSILGTQIFFGL